MFAKEYKLGEVQGRGGYSTVYRATSTMNSMKEVAVKRLEKHRNNKSSEEMKQRFVQESELLSSVNHPNILQHIAHYDESDFFYLVTEYLPGKTLQEHLITDGGFKEKECRSIITSLLKAVKYLHNQNIVHRDLKPENIIYERKEKEGRLTLIDFGFATQAQGMNLRDGVGTLYFAAPEVYKHDYYGTPVDLWSIGVIAYCLLYGQYPFYSRHKSQLAQKILTGQFHFPAFSQSGEIVSKGVQDFISRLLIVNPLRRMTADQALDHPWINTLSFRAAANVLRALVRWRRLIRRFNTTPVELNGEGNEGVISQDEKEANESTETIDASTSTTSSTWLPFAFGDAQRLPSRRGSFLGKVGEEGESGGVKSRGYFLQFFQKMCNFIS